MMLVRDRGLFTKCSQLRCGERENERVVESNRSFSWGGGLIWLLQMDDDAS